jgi:hypothetical protein
MKRVVLPVVMRIALLAALLPASTAFFGGRAHLSPPRWLTTMAAVGAPCKIKVRP